MTVPRYKCSAVQRDKVTDHASGAPCVGYSTKKKSPHLAMMGLQKKAAAYSMTARYCKRSEAGTDAGTDHASGVPCVGYSTKKSPLILR
ncbi:hypothetical protein [Arenibacter sp. S6351L]|uniref:hypothetical protein n=1 Tax=Arenibacter sp. S6351L TaxID=2926407 RepID=UPI001FF67809|nr:hypothetical protein [Arenibacter sp. S6351L]